jgi:hypothetical protein
MCCQSRKVISATANGKKIECKSRSIYNHLYLLLGDGDMWLPLAYLSKTGEVRGYWPTIKLPIGNLYRRLLAKPCWLRLLIGAKFHLIGPSLTDWGQVSLHGAKFHIWGQVLVIWAKFHCMGQSYTNWGQVSLPWAMFCIWGQVLLIGAKFS